MAAYLLGCLLAVLAKYTFFSFAYAPIGLSLYLVAGQRNPRAEYTGEFWPVIGMGQICLSSGNCIVTVICIEATK